MTRPVLILSFILFSIQAFAQDMTGVVNSSYAGINSVILNPARMVNSRLYLDVNFLTGGVFGENNAFYIKGKSYSFRNLFRQPTFFEDSARNGNIVLDRFNGENKFAYANIRLVGPSVMVVREPHAFGFSWDVRSALSIRGAPDDVSKNIYESFKYAPTQNINYISGNWKASGLTWMEVGLSYSYNFLKQNKSLWSAGITLKRLWGYAGFGLETRNLDYEVPDDSTMMIYNLDADGAFALPLDYSNDKFVNGLNFRGGGYAMDLGVSYQKNRHGLRAERPRKLCNQVAKDYDYWIGISLIDFGMISFDRNAREYSFDKVRNYWEHFNKVQMHSLDTFMTDLSYRFYGNSGAAWRSNGFSVYLPTAVSAQADFELYGNVYLNSTVIQGIPIGKYHVSRPSVFSVSPRWETRWFEVHVPVSLLDWRYPRVGLAARIYYVTIGTDKLGGFTPFSDFEGLDFYISIKYNLVKGWCNQTEGVKWGCPNFEYRGYE